MKEPIIADSSCLIGLENVGRLDLLPALFDPIWATPEVQREFGVAVPWLRVEAPVDAALVTALKMLVDSGEAEAIALARERGWRLILDDQRARKVAANLGVRLIGTVGVLVNARKAGILPNVKAVLTNLEANGFFISSELRAEALRLVGE